MQKTGCIKLLVLLVRLRRLVLGQLLVLLEQLVLPQVQELGLVLLELQELLVE